MIRQLSLLVILIFATSSRGFVRNSWSNVRGIRSFGHSTVRYNGIPSVETNRKWISPRRSFSRSVRFASVKDDLFDEEEDEVTVSPQETVKTLVKTDSTMKKERAPLSKEDIHRLEQIMEAEDRQVFDRLHIPIDESSSSDVATFSPRLVDEYLHTRQLTPNEAVDVREQLARIHRLLDDAAMSTTETTSSTTSASSNVTVIDPWKLTPEEEKKILPYALLYDFHNEFLEEPMEELIRDHENFAIRNYRPRPMNQQNDNTDSSHPRCWLNTQILRMDSTRGAVLLFAFDSDLLSKDAKAIANLMNSALDSSETEDMKDPHELQLAHDKDIQNRCQSILTTFSNEDPLILNGIVSRRVIIDLRNPETEIVIPLPSSE